MNVFGGSDMHNKSCQIALHLMKNCCILYCFCTKYCYNFLLKKNRNDFCITPCQRQLISILVYVNVIEQQLLTQVYVQYITSMWQVSVIIHHIIFDIQKTVYRDILL